MSSVKGKSVSEMQIGCENYFWTQYGVEVARLLKDLQNNLKENFFDNADGKVDQVNGSNEITDDSTQHAFSESASEEEECPPPFIQLEKWCIAINGQREGPFDSSTIKNLIVERNLSEIDCLVWEKSMENWCLMKIGRAHV